jgi:glycosyltransferase involved in cell wall biosynthesis
MRVLLLTQVLPFPPDAGPRVKSWNTLRHLAEANHEVTLVSFVRPEETRHLPQVEPFCREVVPVGLRRSRIFDLAAWGRSMVRRRPFLVDRDDLPAMRRAVEHVQRGDSFDVLHADQLTMSQFLAPPPPTGARPVRVFDAHNATWKIIRRSADRMPAVLRPALAVEAARLRRYEGCIVRSFDMTLAVTERDRLDLLEVARSRRRTIHMPRVRVVPITVDTQDLRPIERQPEPGLLLTLGTLHYAPNADGIRWFLREVLPLVRQAVPEARIVVVGKNPPRDLRRLAQDSPEVISVTGYVPDLTPLLRRTAVLIVPVLAGSGMRVRILEGLARGMPIVTTSIGLEGIEARIGLDLLVADRAEDFGAAVIALLRDPERQQRLGAAGRQLVEDHYDRRRVLGRLDQAYQEAIEAVRSEAASPSGMPG